MRLRNFGRNVSIHGDEFCQPQSEEDLLNFLNAHRDQRIRCVGRLHSWSEAISGGDAIVDMQRFKSIMLVESGSETRVRVGAGCQLKQVVAFLNEYDLTLPTLGLIDEQSVAGAISTGTHGSGRHSLSHYVSAVRIASFSQSSGEASIKWITSDQVDDLQAARCSLGCLGIIVEVELPTRKQYRIEEHFRRYATLGEVLSAESSYDLQQFYFVPWRWDFFAQHRVETEAVRSWNAPLYRAFWILAMDVALHLWISTLARWLPTSVTKLSFSQVIPRLIPLRWKVVDRSDRQLTMQHELFRHIEVEVFVPARQLSKSLDFVRELLDCYSCKQGSQQYVHHYPICIRRVLPDNTLISPASQLPKSDADEPWYTISFISYARPNHRGSFESFAKELVKVTMDKFQARPHWGKFCPVNRDSIQRAYPKWDQFAEIVRQNGASGTFLNLWLESLVNQSDQVPRASQ